MKERSAPRLAQPAYAYVLPALISAALLWSAPAHAQDPAPTPAQPATPAAAPVVTTTQDETQGTLTVKVVEAATGKPVKDALITVDGPKLASREQARTDYFGIAKLTLPEGPYDIYFSSTRYRIEPKPKRPDDPIAKGEVKAKQDSVVELKVAEAIEGGGFQGIITYLDPNEFGNVTKRDRRMIDEIPMTGANPQSLPNILRSVPGMVPDSVNQSHPRGENSVAAATYVDGILIPQLNAGRANAFWNQQNIRNLTVRTGGFTPEYGGGSGAIYDIRLRDPDFLKPTLEYGLRLGTYDTREVTFNFGTTLAITKKQGGQRVDTGRRFRYLFGFDSRYTNNALEPPQSGDQTAFNDGASELFFGKIGFDIAPGRTIDVLLNLSSGRTNVAQRTGNNDINPAFGQGVGFSGSSARATGLATQEDLGQKIRQKDNNSLIAVKYAATLPNGTQAQFALGATQSTQAYVNVGTFNRRFINLPQNSSIEFVPATEMDMGVIFVQADIAPPPVGKFHNLKFGASLQFFNGDDVYQYFPQSSDALAALGRLDPRLVPADFNQVAPAIFADRSGTYISAYAQDTFKTRTRKGSDVNMLYFNIGFRLDSYSQSIKTRENQRGGAANNFSLPSTSQTEISPRVNIVFDMTNPNNKVFKQATLVRVGYNRMFAQPAFGQGNYIGFMPGSNGTIRVNPARPQTVDEYDLSIERQVARDKSVRISMYSKDITRILVARQLIEGMQYGFLAVQSLSGGVAEGYEISFDMKPPKDKKTGKEIPGVYGYASLSVSETRPTGRFTTDNLRVPFGQTFYDHDQATTFTLGAAYRLKDGATAGLTLYSGSGLFASALSFPGSALTTGGREAVTQVDLRYNTGPRFWNKRISLIVDVENLTGSTARLNYRNDIAGSRFQQGRRLMLSAVGRY